ncbi:exocyst complex component 6-like [Zophobas morio]|uniref:exocyst complex component 6-like n=1 Tax=Zophobas morio TaxID=2755281 RepID=UPI003082D9ED
MEAFLPKIQGFSLHELVQDSIPTIRESVRSAVISDLQDWMEDIVVSRASEIGNTIINHFFRLRQENQSSNSFLGFSDVPDIGKLVDCTPLYRCLRVFEVFRISSDVQLFYKDAIKKQIVIILNNPGISELTPLERCRALLARIMGFFIVLDSVQTTTEKFITKVFVDDLWNSALDRLASSSLQQEMEKCTDKDQLLELKNNLEAFSTGMQAYQYSVHRLQGIYENAKERYDYLLILEFRALIGNILMKDYSHLLVILDAREWEEKIKPFNFQAKPFQLTDDVFPKSLSFSELLLELFAALQEFADCSLTFAKKIEPAGEPASDDIFASIEKLCAVSISPAVKRMIQLKINNACGATNAIDFEQNSQIIAVTSTSLRCLPLILPGLCLYIRRREEDSSKASLQNDPEELSDVSFENRFKSFYEIREYVDAAVPAFLKAVVQKQFSMADYIWCPSAADVFPSKYINDLVFRLSMTLGPFAILPRHVVKDAYNEAARTMAAEFLALITEVRPDKLLREHPATKINFLIFYKLEQDVIMCEGFCDSCEEPQLKILFEGVRQLIQLFKLKDFDNFVNSNHRQRKYAKLKLEHVIAVLERLLADSGGQIGISRLWGSDKEKSTLESALQRLIQEKAFIREKQ